MKREKSKLSEFVCAILRIKNFKNLFFKIQKFSLKKLVEFFFLIFKDFFSVFYKFFFTKLVFQFDLFIMTVESA